MFLVQFQTAGTEVFGDDERTLIGYDNIETRYVVIAHEDDIDQFEDASEYRHVKILGEIDHADIETLLRQSTRMQQDTAEAAVERDHFAV